MFKVALTEGWLDIMKWGIYEMGTDNSMVYDPVSHEPLNRNNFWAFYFCFFIVVGSWFLLNLFDGVVIDQYTKSQEIANGVQSFSKG